MMIKATMKHNWLMLLDVKIKKAALRKSAVGCPVPFLWAVYSILQKSHVCLLQLS